MSETVNSSLLSEDEEDPTLRQLEIAQQQAILYARELRQLYKAEQEKRHQLEIAHRRLAELDEMKTAFVDLLSHELRTPVALLSGYLELLADGVAGEITDDQKAFFDVAVDKAKQLSGIIEELTTFSRLSAGGEIEAMGIGSLADAVNELHVQFIPVSEQSQIDFRVETADSIPEFTGDVGLIQLVLRHLLRNAFEFNASGGEVILELGDLGDAIQFRVIDTGEGIPKEKREAIFESFRQAEPHMTRRHPGLGLGLNVVQRAVSRLGGQIMLDSEVGQGSTFTILIPQHTSEPEDPLSQLVHVHRKNRRPF